MGVLGVYSMLIVFKGEHVACLKHSSLFKVNFWATRAKAGGHFPPP